MALSAPSREVNLAAAATTDRGNFSMTQQQYDILLNITRDEYHAMERTPMDPQALGVVVGPSRPSQMIMMPSQEGSN